MDFYIRNSAGFFIQIFFSLMLVFIPFRMSSYRIGHKKIVTASILIAMLESLIFPFVVSKPFVLLFPGIMVAADVYMLISICILIVPYCLAINQSWLDKAIVICYAVFYAAVQFLIVNLTRTLNVSEDNYPPGILLAYIVTAAVLFPVFSLILRRFVGPYLARIDTKNTKAELRVVLITVACYAMQMFFTYTFPDPESEIFYTFVSVSFIFFSIVFCIFFGLLFRESLRRTKDEDQKRIYEIQKVRYQNIQNDIENAKRIRHDERHHMRVIADLLEQNKIDEAKVYLSELMNEVHNQDLKLYCSNETINSVLQYYVGWAMESGIRCFVTAKCGELSVNISDITVLIGNSMENAINACKAVDTEKKIDINIGIVNESLAIIIENTCNRVEYAGRKSKTEDYLPAEAFKSLHGGGYGLKSIEATVQKYNGEALFRFDEKSRTFTTRILLNI